MLYNVREADPMSARCLVADSTRRFLCLMIAAITQLVDHAVALIGQHLHLCQDKATQICLAEQRDCPCFPKRDPEIPLDHEELCHILALLTTAP